MTKHRYILLLISLALIFVLACGITVPRRVSTDTSTKPLPTVCARCGDAGINDWRPGYGVGASGRKAEQP